MRFRITPPSSANHSARPSPSGSLTGAGNATDDTAA
jgi:hypothetical protein